MNCGIGHRHNIDPALLRLWCRPGTTAPIGPLAWEPPYNTGVALKIKKKKVLFNVRLLSHRKKNFVCILVLHSFFIAEEYFIAFIN